MYLPIGTVLPYAGPINGEVKKELENNGFLVCDGSEYEQSKYEKLYRVIKGIYGTSGKKFKVPDYQGYFLRGCDQTGKIDPDFKQRQNLVSPDKVGSTQADELKKHKHFVGYSHWRSFVGANDSDKPIKNSSGAVYDTGLTGGNETRPINIYVNYIIYYGI